jgi:hypothetical protein
VRDLWFVDSASDALDEGNRYLVAALNEMLAEVSAVVRIDAPPVRPRDSLRQAQEQFRSALPGLRTLTDVPAEDRDITPWVVGYINDTTKNNRLEFVDLTDSSYENKRLPFLIEFLTTRRTNWTDEDWQRCIVNPVQLHMITWRKWFDRLRHSADAEPPDDLKDYVSATEIRRKHTPDDIVLDQKKLVAFLKLHEGIQTMRPLAKNGKPRTNRLLVHLGDWYRHKDAFKEWFDADSASSNASSESDIAKRIAAVRRKNQSKK